jgi:hypothetical protein
VLLKTYNNHTDQNNTSSKFTKSTFFDKSGSPSGDILRTQTLCLFTHVTSHLTFVIASTSALTIESDVNHHLNIIIIIITVLKYQLITLGAFLKLQKATVSFVMSVSRSFRHGTTRLPLDGFS